VELNLKIEDKGPVEHALFASYTCPCGCNPGVTLTRGSQVATEGCCCGNEFAVGAAASSHIVTEKFVARPGYALQVQPFRAPWGERLEAAWAVGPSTHPVAEASSEHGHGHGHEAEHGHGHQSGGSGGPGPGRALDPVCGMTVDIAAAQGKGLHYQHHGVDYYFCGRGCRLDFEENPDRYLDSKYIPSM